MRKKTTLSSLMEEGDDAPDVAAHAVDLQTENEDLKRQLADLKKNGLGAPAIKETGEHNSRTVTVACKILGGLQLQLQHKMERMEAVRRGSRDDYEMVGFNVFGGKKYFVFGPSVPRQVPDGYIMPPAIEGGYALTPGIPTDFWEKWLEQNKMADYVVNQMIFAVPTMASAKSQAREQEEFKSGMEPLSRDTDKNGLLTDPRIPKPLTANLGRLGFDAERTAQQVPAVTE
jgi:hypothetical protein